MKMWIKKLDGNLAGIAGGAVDIEKTEAVQVGSNWECQVIAGGCNVLRTFTSESNVDATNRAKAYIEWLCSEENLNGTVILDDTDDF